MEHLTDLPDGSEVVSLTRLDEVEQIIRAFEAIAREERWQPGDQLRGWQQSATYFAVVVGGQIVGGLHLVRPTTRGILPCHLVWPELQAQTRSNDAHIVIMALRREIRGREGMLWLLCSEVWRYCFGHQIDRIWLEATPRALKIYQRLGWPLKVVGPLREHWGEPCYPCTTGTRQIAAAMAARGLRNERLTSLILNALRAPCEQTPEHSSPPASIDQLQKSGENEEAMTSILPCPG